MLSVASLIAQAAVEEGLIVRQSEVHGMAQRGGAVLAHLRLASGALKSGVLKSGAYTSGVIAGDLVPKGGADLIIAMEPLEGIRYLSWLKKDGTLVSASDPFINIDDYPDPQIIINAIKRLPSWRLVEASSLAKEAGFAKAVNTVMVGAASCFLPIKTKTLEKTIDMVFSKKDAAAVNAKAFTLGQKAVNREQA